MGQMNRPLGPFLIVVAVVIFWGATAALLPASTGPPVAVQQSGSTYAGQDTCLECHEDKGAQLEGTRHFRALDSRTPAAGLGCESCHGPSLEHADTGDPELMQSFAEKTPIEVSDTCVTCHNKGEHAFWEGSQHQGRDVSCTNCHSVHEYQSVENQFVKPTQTETCAQCHQEKAAKIQRTTHMPLREDTMQCSSCHNPHGSANERLLAEGFTINEACTTSCHAEKRGPYMFEHAPVVENCASCHDPHGSVNDRLLVAKAPMLCQRCHNHTRHPSRVYDALNTTTAAQAYGRACLNCHQAIHGSNHPSGNRLLR